MGMLEDVMKNISERNTEDIEVDKFEDLGKIADEYLMHRTIKDNEDLLRKSCGDRINHILKQKGLQNFVIQFRDKFYKCIRVDMPSRTEYDVPDEVLQKYIPENELDMYKRTTRAYSYGYAQDVTIEMLMEQAEEQLNKEQRKRQDKACDEMEKFKLTE